MTTVPPLTDKPDDAVGMVVNDSCREQSLWPRLWVQPLSQKLVPALARITWLRPIHLTFTGFVFGLVAAMSFTQGKQPYLAAGAMAYQVAYTFDFLDGALARLRHNGSPAGILWDSVLDKLRQFICLLALIWGTYRLTDDTALWLWGVSYLFVSLLDTQVPATVGAVEDGYRLYGTGQPPALEKWLLQMKDRLARHRLRLVFLGFNERELTAMTLGPLVSHATWGLALASVIGLPFVGLRLALDLATARQRALKADEQERVA